MVINVHHPVNIARDGVFRIVVCHPNEEEEGVMIRYAFAREVFARGHICGRTFPSPVKSCSNSVFTNDSLYYSELYRARGQITYRTAHCVRYMLFRGPVSLLNKTGLCRGPRGRARWCWGGGLGGLLYAFVVKCSGYFEPVIPSRPRFKVLQLNVQLFRRPHRFPGSVKVFNDRVVFFPRVALRIVGLRYEITLASIISGSFPLARTGNFRTSYKVKVFPVRVFIFFLTFHFTGRDERRASTVNLQADGIYSVHRNERRVLGSAGVVTLNEQFSFPKPNSGDESACSSFIGGAFSPAVLEPREASAIRPQQVTAAVGDQSVVKDGRSGHVIMRAFLLRLLCRLTCLLIGVASRDDVDHVQVTAERVSNFSSMKNFISGLPSVVLRPFLQYLRQRIQ